MASALISATTAGPKTAANEGSSHSGKSPATKLGAPVRSPAESRSASPSLSGGGACPSPEQSAASAPALISWTCRKAPSTLARGVSSPMINAEEARLRCASKTSEAIAARSFEPANRCERPQSFSASAAGLLRASISSTTSIAAAMRAPGVIGNQLSWRSNQHGNISRRRRPQIESEDHDRISTLPTCHALLHPISPGFPSPGLDAARTLA